VLHIDNLSKTYRRTTVLENLSVAFPTTGLHLIQGDNGAGKTTLLKCISGLESYQGSISWGDEPAAGYVSTAFDDSPAHSALSGLQNLSAILDRTVADLRADPSTFEFLRKDRLVKRTRSYSYGERKKLALTAAFMQNKPCVLLDEPTAGLDARGREVLTKKLAIHALTHCVIASDHDPVFYAALASGTYSMGSEGLSKRPQDLFSPNVGADQR
jgi:ABC-2 type transport system ATP-binding protein